MLYVVTTPIGHLQDISLRALNVLRECDVILCEDTRRSAILLNHYGIKKKLLSYHQFNEAKTLKTILNRIESGETVALCSDAGTPCVSDPGVRLISACIKKNLPFSAIPGPCSLINALVLSGFDAAQFQFIGFLPKKNPLPVLKRILFYPGVTIIFESSERLVSTLKVIEMMDAKRPIAVAREMTKMFEECKRGTAAELVFDFSQILPKGELVLILGPPQAPEIDLEIQECVHLLQELHGLPLKEAIKEAAHLLKLPKNEIYKEIHSLKKSSEV